MMLELPWIQLRNSIHTMHADGLWANYYATSGFVDDPAYHWKPDAQGYQHHHRHPLGIHPSPYRPVRLGSGGVMHLQMSSDKRLRSKQLLYQLQDSLRWPGRKTPDETRRYYSWATFGFQPDKPLGAFQPNHVLAAVPSEWWEPYQPLMKYLHLDDEPWQLEKCREIVRSNAGIMQGLDGFGLELS